jgi:hypothetical protein
MRWIDRTRGAGESDAVPRRFPAIARGLFRTALSLTGRLSSRRTRIVASYVAPGRRSCAHANDKPIGLAPETRACSQKYVRNFTLEGRDTLQELRRPNPNVLLRRGTKTGFKIPGPVAASGAAPPAACSHSPCGCLGKEVAHHPDITRSVRRVPHSVRDALSVRMKADLA